MITAVVVKGEREIVGENSMYVWAGNKRKGD